MEARKKPLHRSRFVIFIIVSLVNVGLILFLWLALVTPAQNASHHQDPLIGQKAPNFTLTALYPAVPGPTNISLANFTGKPIVLNIWSSSCVPCMDEAPLLETQWQQAHKKGVVFLGIDFQDVQSNALKFLRQYAVTYPNVLDVTGTTTLAYGVTGTPETLFINRQGVVVSRAVGQLTPQTLQSHLQALLH